MSQGCTIAEMEAYLFGERVIKAQAGMLARNQRSLDALKKGAASPQDVIRHARQHKDYSNRFDILRAHRAMLMALAERSRTPVLQ